ncbi:MAG: stage II sporulation protein M [Ardenticatenaceae bacterium]
MTPDKFVNRRQGDWEKLENLLKKAQRGKIAHFSERELRSLGDLYRAATADLALAQRDFPRHELTGFLNGLVGRAHHLVYRGGAVERRQIRHFLTAGFPQVVRRNSRYVWIATLLLFGPAFICWWLVLQNPDLAYLLFPQVRGMLDIVVQEGKLWIDISVEESAIAGAGIMTNNIQVTFSAFAGGILGGLLTIYVLILNGMLLGSIFGFVQAYGLGPDLSEFVIGHGPIELSVICLAGGAGLRLGHAIFAPGLMRRRDAITQAAREAMGIITGSALLLIIAGTIEGFISPSDLPWFLKAAVGLSSGMLMWWYLWRGGRA